MVDESCGSARCWSKSQFRMYRIARSSSRILDVFSWHEICRGSVFKKSAKNCYVRGDSLRQYSSGAPGGDGGNKLLVGIGVFGATVAWGYYGGLFSLYPTSPAQSSGKIELATNKDTHVATPQTPAESGAAVSEQSSDAFTGDGDAAPATESQDVVHDLSVEPAVVDSLTAEATIEETREVLEVVVDVLNASTVENHSKAVDDQDLLQQPAPVPLLVNEESPTSEVHENVGNVETVQLSASQPRLPVPTEVAYVIVGAGTAAHAASRAIRTGDPNAKILIIGDEEVLPYMRPPLSKELWFSEDPLVTDTLVFKQWNGKERSVFFEQDSYYVKPSKLMETEGPAVSVLTGKRVIEVDADRHTVKLHSGESIKYGKLLLATGGKPKVLEPFESAPKDVLNRTSVFRTVADFRRLDKISRKVQNIVVIGGGFLGSELTCALAARGKGSGLRVIQIFPEDGNMARVFPKYLSDWTTSKVRAEGADVVAKAHLANVQYANERVELHLDNGTVIPADHVVLCVGIEPDVALARSAGLELDPEHHGFRVNSELEARSDIYAAGDAACFYDMKLGRRRVEHHDHAVVSGRLAGENMTGAKKAYKHQSMFWSDLGPDVGYEAIGIVDSSLPTVSFWAKATTADTPKALVEATGESVRSATEEAAEALLQPATSAEDAKTNSAAAAQVKVTTDSGQTSGGAESVVSKDGPKEEFGKGVIFYMREKRVVGILLWNVFNRMPLARRIIADDQDYDDLSGLAKLFELNEEH